MAAITTITFTDANGTVTENTGTAAGDLNAAILAADNATSGPVTIAITGGDVVETSDPTAIELQNGVSLTVEGNGNALNGQNAHRGLFAYSGAVTIQDLTIENAHAVGGKGGDGGQGGGGGAGLGGGLFVGAGATVSLQTVAFQSDAATGGAGGNGSQLNENAGGGGGLGGAGGNGTNTRAFPDQSVS